MHVLFPYLDHYELAKRAMTKHCPDADWVLTPRGYPHIYPDVVNEAWGKDKLLVVEGDLVITPWILQSMEDCEAPWCVCTYALGSLRTEFQFGYGCIKWSLEFQKAFSYQKVMDHGKSDCPLCQVQKGGADKCDDCQIRMCHRHQDTAFWHEMIRRGGLDVQPHIHGRIRHLHEVNTKAFVAAKQGLLYWTSADGARTPA